MSQHVPGQPVSGWRRLRGFFGENPPWRSRSVAFAAAITIVGLGFWLKDRGRIDADPAQLSVLFRIGASYLGGYLLGWAFRRGLKALAIISAILVGGILLLKLSGWVNLDWGSIQQNVAESFDWLRGEAEGWRKLLSSYLPSVAVAAVGFFFGARRK